MKSWFRHNGLSIVVLSIFVALLVGQALTGWHSHNEERLQQGAEALSLPSYLSSGHFGEATSENWESEFLQMAAYVLFTVFLFQKGSAESKDPDKKEPVDRKPDPHRKDAPGPVRRGGLALLLYRNSLSIALLLLFLLSFVLHAIGGARRYNDEQLAHAQNDVVTAFEYVTTSSFWFESLQNWQSEFLAVLAIVVLSIFLRQHGSPESKPVDAPHTETGE